MKSRIRLLFIALSILVLVTLACGIPGGKTEEPDDDAVATRVAATVAAELTAAVSEIAESTATVLPTEPAAISNELRLFYIDGNRNLWCWTESGGPRQLTSSGDAEYLAAAPDGSRAAYTRTVDSLDYSLWIINFDGSGDRQLLSVEDFSAMKTDAEMQGLGPDYLTWTPDSSSLAFTTSPKYEGPGYMIQDDLWFVNADSGEKRQILAAGMGGAFYFSPDGTKIAMVKPDRISISNIDGSNLREVFAYTPVITYSEYAYRTEPVWSWDSSSLWTAIPPADPLVPGQPTELWRIPADGGSAVRLGSAPVNFLAPVALSPKQDRILYIANASSGGDNTTQVEIANPDGSGPHVVVTGNAGGPLQWSPDGMNYTFTLGSGYNTQLGKLGNGFISLGDGMTAGIRWLSHSTYLFLNKTDAGWEICRASIDGKREVLASLSGDPDLYLPVYAYSD